MLSCSPSSGHKNAGSVSVLVVFFAIIVFVSTAGCGRGGDEASSIGGTRETNTLPERVPTASSTGTASSMGAWPTSTAPASAAPSTSAASSKGPAATASATTKSRSAGVKVIAWIKDLAPLGGGATGLDDEAFASFIAGSCNGPTSGPLAALSEPLRSLYEGANAACLAAFHDKPKLWPLAERRIGEVSRYANSLPCTHRAVLLAAQQLVRIHRGNPEA